MLCIIVTLSSLPGNLNIHSWIISCPDGITPNSGLTGPKNTYIYIYIERERERERGTLYYRWLSNAHRLYVFCEIYIYIERENT